MVLRMVYSCFVVGSVDGWVRVISDYSKVHTDMICVARNAVPYGAVVCINEFTADHLTFYLIRTLLQPSYALD